MSWLCVYVSLSAGLLQKYSADFIDTCCYDWAYQREESVNILVVIRSRIRIPDQNLTNTKM